MSRAALGAGHTAVITGAASGLGLALARQAARQGLNLVMADVQADRLGQAVAEVEALGASVLGFPLDVSQAGEVDALGEAVRTRFGVPHLVFNNAGVAFGGLIWEHSPQDWAWVLGVNLMGVAHGVRVFTPMMLQAARDDPAYRGHLVNTASMAGLLAVPNMGAYTVSKHAVVALSETLHHDLALVTRQVRAHVLCPHFVPTGIASSHRNRPAAVARAGATPTRSQRVAQAMSEKAVAGGRVSAEDVAHLVMDALADDRFYIFSHPQALAPVRDRMEDILQRREPSNPLSDRPDLLDQLRQALAGAR